MHLSIAITAHGYSRTELRYWPNKLGLVLRLLELEQFQLEEFLEE